MMSQFERGRRAGINQCIKFIIKACDEPTIAEEVKNWVRRFGGDAAEQLIVNAQLGRPNPFKRIRQWPAKEEARLCPMKEKG